MNNRKFQPVDRSTPDLFPASVQDYLPEDHLARFVVDVVEQLDIDSFLRSYRGVGSKAWHPSMMLALLFYGYSTGVFSSRKLEKASYDSVAFRYICANQPPDHDSINAFRKRFRAEHTEKVARRAARNHRRRPPKQGNRAMKPSQTAP